MGRRQCARQQEAADALTKLAFPAAEGRMHATAIIAIFLRLVLFLFWDDSVPFRLHASLSAVFFGRPFCDETPRADCTRYLRNSVLCRERERSDDGIAERQCAGTNSLHPRGKRGRSRWPVIASENVRSRS